MSVRKLISLFSFWILAMFFYNCCRDSCCGEDFEIEYPYFEVFGMTTQIMEKDSADEYVKYGGDSIFKADALLYLDFKYNCVSQKTKNTFSFLPSAYACSPPEACSVPKEKIERIMVKTISGIDLTSELYLYHGSFSNSTKIARLDSINQIATSSDYQIKLQSINDSIKSARFIVDYLQTNGENYIDTTEVIYFK